MLSSGCSNSMTNRRPRALPGSLRPQAAVFPPLRPCAAPSGVQDPSPFPSRSRRVRDLVLQRLGNARPRVRDPDPKSIAVAACRERNAARLLGRGCGGLDGVERQAEEGLSESIGIGLDGRQPRFDRGFEFDSLALCLVSRELEGSIEDLSDIGLDAFDGLRLGEGQKRSDQPVELVGFFTDESEGQMRIGSGSKLSRASTQKPG